MKIKDLIEGLGYKPGNPGAYDADVRASQTGMGRGPDHRGLGQELAHERNNYAVAIDGRTWKIFADQSQAQNIARSLQAKGKNATVHPTGKNPSESMEEGFGSNYAEQLAQKMFDQNPNLENEDDMLKAGYAIAKQELGNRANGVFRDDDFASDLISAYNWVKEEDDYYGLPNRDGSNEDVAESATAGATMSGNIATIPNPHHSPGKARGNKSFTGSPWTGSGTKSPPQPKPKNNTGKNGLDVKGVSIFGGPAVKR